MRRTKRLGWISVVLGTVTIAALAVDFVVYRPIRQRFRQIKNAADFWTCAGTIEAFRERHGSYPSALVPGESAPEWYEGKDSWGNPVVYLSDGDRYLLVSVGQDGRPDGENWLELRRLLDEAGLAADCEPFRDQILSDRGWIRACGK